MHVRTKQCVIEEEGRGERGMGMGGGPTGSVARVCRAKPYFYVLFRPKKHTHSQGVWCAAQTHESAIREWSPKACSLLYRDDQTPHLQSDHRRITPTHIHSHLQLRTERKEREQRRTPLFRLVSYSNRLKRKSNNLRSPVS